jgi:cephalosporin hydroxylase
VWRDQDRSRVLADYAERHMVGRGLWKWTHYFDAYERHLAKFVGAEVNVVEIGVYSGGSLEMWRDYFGPHCQIIGVDIAEECRAYEDDQISILIGDQADPQFWREFLAQGRTIDVVIDDGGHQVAQQMATLEALLPSLSPGGVYICEDIAGVNNPFHADLAGLSRNLDAWNAPNPRESRTVPCAFQTMIAAIHRYPYLVIIERAADPPTEFISPRRGTEWVSF